MVTPPQAKAPPLSCDCHFHIFGAYDRFPLDAGRLFDQFCDWVPGAALRQRILMDNPAKLYGFAAT